MQLTDATMITSRRSKSAFVAAWRSLSIFLVPAGVLLDVRVRTREVRLRLVVVEVGDEVLDGVVGEEVAKLGVELGCQRLVVGKHERGSLVAGDHACDRERLARAGRPKKRLVAQPARQAIGELLDRLWLVSGGLERRNELELGHPETIARDQACRTPVRYLFRAGCPASTRRPPRRSAISSRPARLLSAWRPACGGKGCRVGGRHPRLGHGGIAC